MTPRAPVLEGLEMTWNEIEKENEARRRVINRKMAELRSTFDVEFFHGSFHGPRHAEAGAAWIAFLAELERQRVISVVVHARASRKHGFFGRTIATTTVDVLVDACGFGDTAAADATARAALAPLVGGRKFAVSFEWFEAFAAAGLGGAR